MIKANTLTITTIIVILFIGTCNLIFFPHNVFSWDVFGYYSYLPLKFIYHSLDIENLTFIEGIVKEYNSSGTLYQFMQLPNGKYLIKYPMGLSYFYAPFFFAGHLIAKIFHLKTDGYSAPYQISVFIGCILYTIAAVLLLSKVLRHFFNDKISSLVLLIVVFGTNFIVHVTKDGQNTMSHALLFFTYSGILWCTIQWHQYQKLKHIIFLGILVGLTMAARPSEIVCVFIPLLWNVYNLQTLKSKWQLLCREWKHVLVFFVLVLLILFPQLLYWKTQTNQWLFDSYGNNPGEGFEFLHPYIYEVLFSFRKGWFVYTPVMLIAVAGFYHLKKAQTPIFYALFVYFIVNLFIVSSWSCWWYAQSFSQRALIPSYPVMAIVLGYVIQWMSNKKLLYKISFLLLIAILVFLNLFQTVQFHKGIISGDRMTLAYYARAFLKLSINEEDKKMLLVDRSFSGITKFTNEENYHKRIIEIIDFENQYGNDTTLFFEGSKSFKMDSTVIYTPAVEAGFLQLTSHDHAWIRAKTMVYIPNDVDVPKFSMIFHFENRKKAYAYVGFDAEYMQLKKGAWNLIQADYLTPEVRSENDLLKVYMLQRGKEKINIDNFIVEVFEPNEITN